LGNKSTRGRGRPEFVATAALKRKVSTAAGGGMSHEEIALALGISRKTLEKHFEHELSVGAYQRRMEALEGLHRAAKKGNVGAARAYLQTQPALAVPPLGGTQPGASATPPAGAEPPMAKAAGKKEQAAAAAATAADGSDWADLLPSRMGIH
jgi:DNA-binding CsgD family transcriptional regulator